MSDEAQQQDPIRHDAIQGEIWHVYDGIEEADNRLPLWWLAVFYGSVVFGVGYWFAYHEYGIGRLPEAAYALAVEQAEFEAEVRAKELADQVGAGGLAGLADDPGSVDAGRAAYLATCAACHGAKGEGKIGPNLTDDHWLHGGSAEAIHATIEKGVVAKGMPAWGPILGGVGVQQLTAYVLSMRGTHVPGKEPQGEVWKPTASDEGAKGEGAPGEAAAGGGG